MTNKKRIEKDSLGPVELPSDALYGPQTQRALENFGYSNRRLPLPFIMALVQVKKAAAKANQACESISPEKSRAIISACDKIISMISKKENVDVMFPVSVFQTGSGTSSNMNMNEVIAHLANSDSASQQQIIHPNDDVNYGQSSNDVIPTSIQLSVLTAIHEDLFPAIELATRQLGILQETYQGVIKTGRTHLMDAMPLSLGDELGTWRYQIQESRERLQDSLGDWPKSLWEERPLAPASIAIGAFHNMSHNI